jgi:hypothetical protein
VHEGENPARTEPASPASPVTAGTVAAGTVAAGTATAEAAGAVDVTGRVAGVLQGIGPVLGIDAGGTGTRAVLIVDGAPTQRYSSGPFNFLLDGDGVPRMAALVRAARPAAVGIGIPGLARVPDAEAAFAAAITAASALLSAAPASW